MAFQVPHFPIFAAIWRGGGVGGAYASPDVVTAANLSPGRRVLVTTPLIGGAGSPVPMELLLPARTDIRASWNGAVSDLVEVPSGSKRFYTVAWVDDVGRGFANEYRLATMYYLINGNTTLAGGPFPAPTPLP